MNADTTRTGENTGIQQTAAEPPLDVVTKEMKALAHSQGFELVGVAPAVSPPGFPKLLEWINAGFAGEMRYLERRKAAYEHPDGVLPKVRSVIMVAMNYGIADTAGSATETRGRVAKYAAGNADYHDFLRERLKPVRDLLHRMRPGCTTRIVVDTAPLLERDFARLAGLGWFGKNTMLINRRAGSFLLLAALLTDLELMADLPHETSHCGTCTRCLDVCPTDAFVGPYVLDARKCISYLTIELKTEIPRELRSGVGDWMFGCDLCQNVCPWNRKATVGIEAVFRPSADLPAASALSILQMTRIEFENRFSKTPLERPGFDGLRRNAAIVVGNSRDTTSIPVLIQLLQDPSPLVRGSAAWALGQFQSPLTQAAIRDRLMTECDETVIAELSAALTIPQHHFSATNCKQQS